MLAAAATIEVRLVNFIKSTLGARHERTGEISKGLRSQSLGSKLLDVLSLSLGDLTNGWGITAATRHDSWSSESRNGTKKESDGESEHVIRVSECE